MAHRNEYGNGKASEFLSLAVFVLQWEFWQFVCYVYATGVARESGAEVELPPAQSGKHQSISISYKS